MLKFFHKVTEANNEIARLQEEITKAQTALETVKGEHTKAVEVLQASITAKDSEIAGLKVQLAESQSLVTSTATQVEALKAAQTTVEQKGAEQAAAIAASVGVTKPVEGAANSDGTKTREQLWTEYAAQPVGEKQNAFYKKHRMQMREA